MKITHSYSNICSSVGCQEAFISVRMTRTTKIRLGLEVVVLAGSSVSAAHSVTKPGNTGGQTATLSSPYATPLRLVLPKKVPPITPKRFATLY